jgi:hypothetical protein
MAGGGGLEGALRDPPPASGDTVSVSPMEVGRPKAVRSIRRNGASAASERVTTRQLFIRASVGSNSGVGPATSTVTGYSSFMYMTCSLVPTTACCGGR